MDWKINDPKNIVLVLHGLTGGGDCNYIKDTLERLYDAGYTAVCFNNRGVGFTKLSVLFKLIRHLNTIIMEIHLI